MEICWWQVIAPSGVEYNLYRGNAAAPVMTSIEASRCRSPSRSMLGARQIFGRYLPRILKVALELKQSTPHTRRWSNVQIAENAAFSTDADEYAKRPGGCRYSGLQES